MKYTARVTRTVQQTPTVTTIYFVVDKRALAFVAGQYICVYFEAQTGHRGGKAYSLSSAPHDSELSISVKSIGEVSGLLCSLQVGDTFSVSSPFGFFNVRDDAPLIAIAAGVGIAPIWSIIRDEAEKGAQRSMTLFLTAPLQEELVFRDEIDALCRDYPAIRRQYFVTQEGGVADDTVQLRRLEVARDIAPLLGSSPRIYVCGSEAFVRSIWQQLMACGVDQQQIVTETFFEALP